MILRELKNDVISLGFDDMLEREDLFITSANRALRTIYSERVISKTVKLFAHGQTASTRIKELRHIGGEDVTLPLVGRAYSMRVCGEGKITVYDGKNKKIIEFNSENEVINGLLTSGGSILFSGDYSYTVYNLVTFDEVFSSNTADIPDGSPRRVYDIRAMFGDFLSFMSLPRDGRGQLIDDCSLCDGKLELDSSYRGEIILTYRRLPMTIVADLPDVVIDIPEEFAPLLSLLTASYVWLDDDEEKAKYYRELYSDMLKNIKASSYESVDTGYRNTNRWA